MIGTKIYLALYKGKKSGKKTERLISAFERLAYKKINKRRVFTL